jgi:hypothetical protein
MCTPHNPCHYTCDCSCLGALKPSQFKLQILGVEFANDDLPATDFGSNHPISEKGRKIASACHDTLRVVCWHFGGL